jgi:16S rRNA (guanine527-N7)-methyltransferase
MNTTALPAAFSSKLAQAIDVLQLTITPTQQQLLLQYLVTLHKWNKAYNLSGLEKLEDMLVLHLIDSLTVLPYIQAERVADIGTGAGLPGLVLAICLPDTQFFLMDSNGKKTRFLFQAAVNLGLRNVQAIHTRVEDYAMVPQVAIVISRAFASIRNFVETSQHLLSTNGALLAMKGQYPTAEIADLPTGFALVSSHVLNVPGSTATRHLLDIRRSNVV